MSDKPGRRQTSIQNGQPHDGPRRLNDWRKFKLESQDSDSIPPSKKEILRQMSSPQSRNGKDSEDEFSRQGFSPTQQGHQAQRSKLLYQIQSLKWKKPKAKVWRKTLKDRPHIQDPKE
uniref:PhLOP2 n=1 Tax=Homo sapiens TaxID=9606 RepID=Q9Y6H7_HUMAN|nr:PhLOP2 [Homo sapiens]